MKSSESTGAHSLGSQIRRQLPSYLAGVLLLGVLQTLMGIRDRLFKTGVDAAVASDESETTRTVLFILVLVVVAAGVRVLSRITIFHAGRNAEYHLRGVLLAHLHRLGFSFFQKMATGEIMSRATNDLGQVRLLLGFGVLNIVNTVFALISALSVMIDISPHLTLAALTPFPLLALATRTYGRVVFSRTRANQEALGILSGRVQESLAGIRVVRSFSLESKEQFAFEKASNDFLKRALSLARARGLLVPIMGTIGATGMLIVFWYGGHLVLTHEITEGDFIAFWSALTRLTWPIIALGFVISIVQRGRAGYGRIKEILDVEPDVVDGDRGHVDQVKGELRIRDLSFSHAGQEVLSKVNLHVPAGTSLAVVGRVGSGKSTLATLVARLLPTPCHTVFLDGHDVCDLPLHTVRRAIGYAQQDAFLFSTTVARNIGFALDHPDTNEGMDRIRFAAKEAHILEEVQVLPDGFDSVVGERGLQLSGGQKQRVALARALLYEPAILVLDDPLSAVDARTERAILQAIDKQAKRRTVVLVTSRTVAAARCDRVVVLDKGRVVEQGTHEQLVAQGGIYAKFEKEQRLQGEIAGLAQEGGLH